MNAKKSRRARQAESPAAPDPGLGDWTLQIYEAEDGTSPFTAFVEDLDLYSRRVLDVAVTTVLARQGHNVCSSEWGKALGRGLYEFRVRRSLAALCHAAGVETPGDLPTDHRVLLRAFFAVEGRHVVLLLCGYDKGADPSEKRQDREIARARTLLARHLESQRRHSKDLSRRTRTP